MKIFKHPRVLAVRRYVKLTLSVLAACVAVAIVATLTIDLGPHVRELAERAGSEQIERRIHIGRLSLHVLTGRVIVEDFSIDGLHPGDRPLGEYLELASRAGFRLIQCRGIFPTVPVLTRLIRRSPAKLVWLHRALTRLLPVPGWGFLSVLRFERP